jgi:hypothetical protein
MDSDTDDDSMGDPQVDLHDEAKTAEITATQTREKLNEALIKVKAL